MLTISEMTKAFGARVLFEDASLQVNRGDRIGLVGPNGAGKSTLFSLVLGHDSPDAGEVSIERNTTIGHLPQETAPVSDETVLELATAIPAEAAEFLGQQLAPKAKKVLAGLAFRERDFDRRAVRGDRGEEAAERSGRLNVPARHGRVIDDRLRRTADSRA